VYRNANTCFAEGSLIISGLLYYLLVDDQAYLGTADNGLYNEALKSSFSGLK
jgi:hypothetical protein